MVEMSEEEFEDAVSEALDTLPEELAAHMDNVVVLVDDANAEEPDLLGLYEGIPLTERDGLYAGVLPDRITVYRLPTLDVGHAAPRSSTTCASRSSTRSRTTSASTTTACTTSATADAPRGLGSARKDETRHGGRERVAYGLRLGEEHAAVDEREQHREQAGRRQGVVDDPGGRVGSF